MSETAHFSIEINSLGRGKMVVNGEDISDKVQAAQVNLSFGMPTVLVLELAPSAGTLEGEGIIQVHTPADPVGALRGLSASEIEAEASNRLGWGDSGTLTAVIIDVIAERLQQNAS